MTSSEPMAIALAPPAPAGAGRGRTRLVWAIAAAALLLDVAVCVPFIFDPLGWRDPTFAAPGAPERIEWVVFLAGPAHHAERERFFAANPLARVEHEGTWAGGTLVVSVPAAAQELVQRLRGEPFVRLMTRGGVALCRAS